MIRLCGSLLLFVGLVAPAVRAQVAGASTQSGTGVADATPTPTPQANRAAEPPKKTDFHIEGSLFYSAFTPGAGSQNWRGGDFRLTYTGINKIAPFVSVARIQNSDGSQLAYGFGSYFTVNRYFYMIGGVSASQETEIQFSPHRRYDLAGFVAVPKVRGMALSVGWTELPAYRDSGGGRIIALGNLYYWRKFIFSGSLNLNFARPGSQRSVSGQFSATYGTQGRYYIAGGMSGGGAAYMLVTGEPFLVQYQSMGAFTNLAKWIAPNAGINIRYDYSHILDSAAHRHSLRLGAFYEF
ncbi:MAG: YaiO family outer membrane beta-barrel protein [Acidobacteria bacterium]|nr:YaiO family outer membrane beta-barrel protein [Acidobacteriota bacterium]